MKKHGMQIILLALISLPAYSGFYVKVINASNQTTVMRQPGYISNCVSNSRDVLYKAFVTPQSYTVTEQIDEYIKIEKTGSPTHYSQLIKLPCIAEAGDLPDPSTVSPGIDSGTSGEQTMYEFTNAQMAIDMSFQLFGLALGLYATIWGLKRVAALFSKDVG